MTQFEQENDLGRGGGEVDDETMGAALDEADRRRQEAGPQPEVDEEADAGEPWAKTSSGDDDAP